MDSRKYEPLGFHALNSEQHCWGLLTLGPRGLPGTVSALNSRETGTVFSVALSRVPYPKDPAFHLPRTDHLWSLWLGLFCLPCPTHQMSYALQPLSKGTLWFSLAPRVLAGAGGSGLCLPFQASIYLK